MCTSRWCYDIPDAVFDTDMPLFPDAVHDCISNFCLQQKRNHAYCTQRGVAREAQRSKLR